MISFLANSSVSCNQWIRRCQEMISKHRDLWLIWDFPHVGSSGILLFVFYSNHRISVPKWILHPFIVFKRIELFLSLLCHYFPLPSLLFPNKILSRPRLHKCIRVKLCVIPSSRWKLLFSKSHSFIMFSLVLNYRRHDMFICLIIKQAVRRIRYSVLIFIDILILINLQILFYLYLLLIGLKLSFYISFTFKLYLLLAHNFCHSFLAFSIFVIWFRPKFVITKFLSSISSLPIC